MGCFAQIMIVTFLFVGYYTIAVHSAFSVCLLDDVEFHYGKGSIKQRKKERGFWRKFLFIDIRKKVVSWHYIAFWCNLLTTIASWILLCIYIISENGFIKVGLLVTIWISFMSVVLVLFTRFSLYAGNKVRCRKPYRHRNNKK